MTSAVHSALPKTERHAPSTAHGGKSTKTGTDFQRLLHGGTEHRRAEVKPDDTETSADNAIAAGEHDPVRAKLNEKAATNDTSADLNLADADFDQHEEDTAASRDGRSTLDVLSSLISLNAADRSARMPSPSAEAPHRKSAPTNETIAAADHEIEQPVSGPVERHSHAATAKQELHVAQEGGILAADNSKPAVSTSNEPTAKNAPANDNPKVTLPAEHHAVDPNPQMSDHRTVQAAGGANPPVRPKAPADAPASAPSAPAPPAEMASTTRPTPHAEQTATVDARITVTESRQYPAPIVESGTQKRVQPEKTAAPVMSPGRVASPEPKVAAPAASTNVPASAETEIGIAPAASGMLTATVSTETSKPAVRSETRAQPSFTQRTVSAGGSAKPELGVPLAHIPAKPSTADAGRAEPATAPAPTQSTDSPDTALALNSTTEPDGQPSDPPAQLREKPKIEAPAARNDTASGINATVLPPQTTITTGEVLATSIVDGLGEKKPLAAPANMPVPSAQQHQSAHVLKIELHPAELGAVTANLKVVGEQLSIEIQVENHEAYRRLSNDSDDLTNTLRKLGYDVDRITILQPQTAATPASRADAQTSSTNTSSRDQSATFSSGQGGNGSSGGDGQRSGRDPSHDAYAQRDTTAARGDDSRGGIVI